jgi:hypothetical protein
MYNKSATVMCVLYCIVCLCVVFSIVFGIKKNPQYINLSVLFINDYNSDQIQSQKKEDVYHDRLVIVSLEFVVF